MAVGKVSPGTFAERRAAMAFLGSIFVVRSQGFGIVWIVFLCYLEKVEAEVLYIRPTVFPNMRCIFDWFLFVQEQDPKRIFVGGPKRHRDERTEPRALQARDLRSLPHRLSSLCGIDRQ